MSFRNFILGAYGLLLILCSLGLFMIYRQHLRQGRILNKIESLESRYEFDMDQLSFGKTPDATQVTPEVPSRWISVQKNARDAVMQVFTNKFEFNWIEPYRTPEQSAGVGSGFFINEDGHFLTNYHVVSEGRNIQIQLPSFGKERFDAEIVGVNPERDLARLVLTEDSKRRIREKLGSIPFLKLGNSDLLARGEEILALGFPLGQEHLKSTHGIISGVEKPSLVDQLCLQITAPINPGNSGGPSLNSRGEVIGINFAMIQFAQNVGYVLPMNDLRSAIKDLEKVRFLRKPRLGCDFQISSDAISRYLGNPTGGGAYVSRVRKNSIAEKMGMQEGDVVYELNGHKLDYFGDTKVPWNEDKVSVVALLNRYNVGDKINLVVYRKGAPKEFSAELEHSLVPPMRLVYPDYEKVDYEVFGGMVFMDLSMNHVLIMSEKLPTITRYALHEKQYESSVVLTHIIPTSISYLARGQVMPGDIIDEINGIKVTDLKSLRDAVKKSKETGFISIKTEDKRMAPFPVEPLLKDEDRLASLIGFPKSELLKELE